MTHAPSSAGWRSWLYVPGDRPDRITKALEGDADCVIIDLEDAVAPADKDQARSNVLDALAHPTRKPVLVRINASVTTWQAADLTALRTAAHLAGIRVPKSETPNQIAEIAGALPDVPMHVLIESAVGLKNADDLASAHANVASIALGEADLRADLRITDDQHLGYARGRVIAAAAAAGLMPPPQSVFTNIEDDDTLRATSMMAKAGGFFGRTVIHPRQVGIVNQVFLPTTVEVDQARALVEALAQSSETAALVLPDGQFVDPAVAAGAQRVLDIAEAFGTNSDLANDPLTKGAP